MTAALPEILKHHGLAPGDWLAAFGDVPGHVTADGIERLIGELTSAVAGGGRVDGGEAGEAGGAGGHLIVPTFSKGDNFHHDSAPALTGRLAERFRTWPGVVRSRHPLYSVAVWGPRAREVVRDHDLYLPFRPETPLGQLAARDGMILLFGGDQRANPVIHVARMAARPQSPSLWVNVHVATEFGGTRKKRFLEAPCARMYAELGQEFADRGIAQTLETEWGQATGMRARAVFDCVSAIERNDPQRLLCGEPRCKWCRSMRKMLGQRS
jgi:hypothetical protein